MLAPTLKHNSVCQKTLHFGPIQTWPRGIPAVGVNGFIVAGFEQEFVFDHQVIEPLQEQRDERIATLFRSLYFDLSFTELARLYGIVQKNSEVSWFPWKAVFQKFQLSPNQQMEKVMEKILSLPIGFQNWCAEKKLYQNDLLCLLSANDLNLNPLFLKLVQGHFNKNQGTLALELAIELLLMEKTFVDLMIEDNMPADEWLDHLKALRYPDAHNRDKKNQKVLDAIGLPSSTQAKWVRRGDKAGVEVKFFVSQPSDVQKNMQGLTELQNLLDNQNSDLWTKH